MKLSMWMVVNLLHNMDISDIHISENAPINLRSARRVFATDCIHVYQKGPDAICKSGEDYFVLKDIDPHEAIEIVQSVFDYYDDWEYTILEASRNLDFQKIVDKSWHILRNPIVLMDANWNVVGISNRYAADELDEEWSHLCRFGSSSLDSFHSLKNDVRNNFVAEGAHYYRMNSKQMSNCISSMITYRHASCGRISVLEYERELNRGDIQIVDYLVNTISVYMGVVSEAKDNNFISIFHRMLGGKPVEAERLERQMEYLDWDVKNDSFIIYVAQPTLKSNFEDASKLLKTQLGRLMPQCEILVYDNNVVMIMSMKHITSRFQDTVFLLNKNHDFYISKSLVFQDIYKCSFFYKQALFAIQRAMQTEKDFSKEIIDFYDYAIEFIIRNSNEEEAMFSCHPDIVKLWEYDNENNSDRRKTFSVYLNNERSLQNAAKALFVHRNTLVYRINKIMDMLSCNLEDVYTRDYMKLSIRIIDMYGNK